MTNKYSAMTIKEIQICVLHILSVFIDLCDRFNIEYCLIGGGCLGIVRHNNSFVPWDDDLDIAIFTKDIPLFLEAMTFLPKPYKIHIANEHLLNPSYQVFNDQTRIKCHNSSTLTREMGVFVDIVPMMVWPAKGVKDLDNLFSKISMSRFYCFSNGWKKYACYFVCLLKIDSLSLFLQRYILKYIFHPLILKLELFLIIIQKGIVSGATGSQWKGKYTWKTIFPVREENFEGIKVKVPNNLNDFLKIRYGENYMNIPKQSECWQHFDQAYYLLK